MCWWCYINIPPFIKVVPTLYLVNNKSVLTNNDLLGWVSQFNKKESADILAYNGDNISSLSTSFSFLDDSSNLSSNKYTFLNESSTINTPKELSSDNNQIDNQLSKDYERLQQMRNNDSFNQGIQRI